MFQLSATEHTYSNGRLQDELPIFETVSRKHSYTARSGTAQVMAVSNYPVTRRSLQLPDIDFKSVGTDKHFRQ